MRAFLNQHSYLLLALVVLAVAAAIALRFETWPLRAVVLSMAALLLALGNLLLRTTPSPLETPDQGEALLQGGIPTLVEFYSNL